MTGSRLVGLLVLLGEVEDALRQFTETLRSAESVDRVDRKCDIHSGPKPSIEWFVDAELDIGEALSWQLLLYHQESEWIVESELRRVHKEGSDVEVELPTRYALDDDLDAELRSATRQLIATGERLTGPGI